MATEYEAPKAGKITQVAPALRAKTPLLAAELNRQFGALAPALPGLTPPASPMPADRMQATVAALAKSLTSISD